ncbi:MAG: hypothetical protein CMJ31_05035 [Phycisphaerae bacterium]|nr:hypothetical protein [Phycisphaerae bacterium]
MRTSLRTLLRPTTIALVVGAAASASVLSGCGDSDTASTTSSEITRVSNRDFEITTLATGELQSRNKVEIRSRVEGTTSIVEIVPEGSRVKEGDVLVRLNEDEIKRELEEEELQYSEAKLNLEAAQSEYEIQISDNAANLRKAQLAVDLAELALEQWVSGDHTKQLAERNTAVEKTTRDLERLQEKIVKSRDLYERKFLSYDEWQRDEIALLEAEAAASNAKLDLRVYTEYQTKADRAQKESDLEEARQELVRVEKANDINLKNKASRRENRAVQLARREERLEGQRQQLRACEIVAPRSGLVVYGTSLDSDNWRNQNEGPLSIGRQVRQNDLLIVLPDTSEMVASVKVHESMAGRIRPGQTASVRVEAAGNAMVEGVVDSVGVLAEGGGWRDPNRREYTVKVQLTPREGVDLKPSMRCEARITLGEVDGALTVPVQAVFSDGPVRFVYVESAEGYERRPVGVGRRSDLFAEITAGIDEGERILLRSARPGEITKREWDEAALTRAGYSVDEDGNPQAPTRGRRGPGIPVASDA